MKKNLQTRHFLSALAFFSILFAAIALTLAMIFTNNESVFAQIINVIKQISYALAFVVAGIYAYGYIKSKSFIWLLIYVAACVIVAVFLILPMFKI